MNMHLMMIANMDFVTKNTCPIVFKLKSKSNDINLTGKLVQFATDKNIIKLMEEINEVNNVSLLDNIAVVKFVPMFQINIH